MYRGRINARKNAIFYVGNAPGTDNVINYHKKELRDVFIEQILMQFLQDRYSFFNTYNEAGATVVIV